MGFEIRRNPKYGHRKSSWIDCGKSILDDILFFVNRKVV